MLWMAIPFSGANGARLLCAMLWTATPFSCADGLKLLDAMLWTETPFSCADGLELLRAKSWTATPFWEASTRPTQRSVLAWAIRSHAARAPAAEWQKGG